MKLFKDRQSNTRRMIPVKLLIPLVIITTPIAEWHNERKKTFIL